jgi:hypothetical protein
MDWIDAIGYQHEPLHAGAIAVLFDHVDSSQELGEAFFGQAVRHVRPPEREK